MPVLIEYGLFCRCEREPALDPKLNPPIVDLELVNHGKGFATRATCGRCGKVGSLLRPFVPHIPDEIA